VFLSYASQDAEAAQRICEALRAAGIEVWFDQSELRGGEAWDQSIRKQIHDCVLFIPIISANSQARPEGYFRLEWKLAVERTHLMSDRVSFLVPVVIDDTSDALADVPERFRAVQWTHLAGGMTQPEFVARIKRLLLPEARTAAKLLAGAASASSPVALTTRAPSTLRRGLLAAAALLVVAALAYLLINKPWISKPAGPPAMSAVIAAPTSPTAFNPPPHSIAVLPFVNLSGDKDQEYFSEGLTEELLNSLVEINDLQVAARTSSFSFKEHPDIVTVAHKLNVGSVLEGSVRRSAQTVRVTAQLINAVTGFHLWSKTYDRNLGDVLKLQTEIATSVAEALKVTLLGDISRKIELGGTNNPAAFDAYLHGRRIERADFSAKAHQAAIAAYTEAIHLDPNYALAFAERSGALSDYGIFDVHDPATAHATLESALKDAVTATTLAPELAEGYLALGVALRYGMLEFARADEAYERALALAPGNARVLASYSRHAAEMGRTAAALNTGRRAITLDPLNFNVYRMVGITFVLARRYAEALASFQMAISLQPDLVRLHVLIGRTQYAMGAYEAARKSCEIASADDLGRSCLAIAYRKLGRNVEAEAMLQELKSTWGDSGALTYASIYAQWGDTAKALEWLDKAVRLRDSGLGELKTDGTLDPLRNEPRFQAIERELKFPD
jgi:TolB-like protein/Tfp pilus assembly protein PilF